MPRFVRAVPAFIMFGAEDLEGSGCTLIVSDVIQDFNLMEERTFQMGPWTSHIECVCHARVTFRGDTMADCFRQMAEHYARRGGRFTEQRGLPEPTGELGE